MSSDTLEALPSAVVGEARARVKRSLQRASEGPLIPVPTKLPASLRHELRTLAEQQGMTLSAFVRTTLEAALRSGVGRPSLGPPETPPKGSGKANWSRRITVRLALEDLRRTEAYAARAGLRKATALAEIVHLGLESAEEREGIPGARADAILRVLHAQEALVSQMGPALFGALVLLAFSVARGTSGKISEDELLTQARLVGEDEWARIVDELGHAEQEEG